MDQILKLLTGRVAALLACLKAQNSSSATYESRLRLHTKVVLFWVGQMRKWILHHNFPMLMRAQTGLDILESHCGAQGAALGAEVLSLKIGMALEIVQFWVEQSSMYEGVPLLADSSVDLPAVTPSAVTPSAAAP